MTLDATPALPVEPCQLPPEKARPALRAADEKWGSAVLQLGYCMVPSLLLQAQNRLKLTPTQLAVLLQLCDFWWEKARKPFPSKETLAVRLGMTARQVQRHLATLEQMKLIMRIARFDARTNARETNFYDLSGLVEQLKHLEPDFKKAEEEIREKRQQLQLRSYKRSPAVLQKASS